MLGASRESGDIDVVLLSRRRMVKLASDLAALDDGLRKNMGDMYADTAWSADSFIEDRPGKWQFSFAAKCEKATCGFWIASLRGPGWLHTHRVGVSEGSRRSGVGRKLFQRVLSVAQASSLDTITALVNPSNRYAQGFYAALGFHPLKGPKLESFAESFDPAFVAVVDASELDRHGRRHLALLRNVKETL